MRPGATVLGLAAVVATLLPAGHARAALPSAGWPQSRHDEALTGRAAERALVDPVVVWATYVGESLGGEPVVSGCAVHVVNGGGEVLAVNARSGGRVWRSSDVRLACGPVSVRPSALALDERGTLLAGLPGDPGLVDVVRVLCDVLTACQSYAVDNNEYPPGLDLPSELAPIHITWPSNPCTGAPLAVSDVPSLGDLRYERVAPDLFHAGVWWTDGGLVEGSVTCGWPGRPSGRLAPGWPRSRELGGGASGLDAADGTVLWADAFGGLAVNAYPNLGASSVTWTQDGIQPWDRDLPDGRVHATMIDGTPLWELRRLGACRGAAARDTTTGRLFVAHGVGRYDLAWNRQAQEIAALVETWAIDNAAYPPTGELAPLLVPTYAPSMPFNVLTGQPVRWSPTPSPGDYDYFEYAGQSAYQVALWNDLGQRVAVVDAGSMVQPSTDAFSAVACYEPDGRRAWQVRLSVDLEPTPLLLAPGGTVVVGDAGGRVRALDVGDGSERWSVDVGEPCVGAPALLPDGGVVFVTASGALCCVEAPGVVRWTYPTGASVVASPTVGADGVVLLGDLGGTLHAVRADGALAWSRGVTGGRAAGVSTAAALSEGWVHVGLEDGRLVALAERATWGLPPRASGVLLARRVAADPTAALLEWPSVALPSVPGAHYHLRRWEGEPTGASTHVLAPHDHVTTSFTDATPGVAAAFYDLEVSDCGENEPAG